MKNERKIQNDSNGLSAIGFIALALLGGISLPIGVWAYEQISGTPLYSASTGIDLMDYVWVGIAVLGLLFVIVLLKPRK